MSGDAVILLARHRLLCLLAYRPLTSEIVACTCCSAYAVSRCRSITCSNNLTNPTVLSSRVRSSNATDAHCGCGCFPLLDTSRDKYCSETHSPSSMWPWCTMHTRTKWRLTMGIGSLRKLSTLDNISDWMRDAKAYKVRCERPFFSPRCSS